MQPKEFEEDLKSVKDKADLRQAIAEQNWSGQTVGTSPVKPDSVEEELRKSADYHYSQFDKQADGANFLRAHPEFDKFIKLIRKGSIQI